MNNHEGAHLNTTVVQKTDHLVKRNHEVPKWPSPSAGNHHPNSGENHFLAFLYRHPPNDASLIITLDSASL